MRPEAFAAPLTVWVGSAHYTFPPGRDVAVGRDSRADIPLEDPEHNEWTSRIHLLLRFDGIRWIAIDTSRNGIYVEGERVATVNIRDGQTITVGDPRDGQRLLFRLGAAAQQASRPPDTGSRRGPARPPPPTAALPVRQPGQQTWRKPPRFRRPGPPAQRKPLQPTRPGPPQGPPQQGPSQLTTDPIPVPPPAPPPAQPSTPPAVVEPPPTQSAPPEPPSESPTEPLATPEHKAPPAPPPAQPPQSAQPVPPQPLETRPPEGPAQPEQAQPPVPAEAAAGEPALPVPLPEVAQQQRQDRAGRVSGAIQKWRPGRSEPRPHEQAMTGPMPGAPPGPPSEGGSAGTPVSALPAAPRTRGLRAQHLNATTHGRQVLTEVSLSANPGTLTAVLGPAGSGRTTLINTLGGIKQPSLGDVIVDGHDVNAEHEAMRGRIGLVPHEDALHRQLTIEQALGYTAQLRLPAGTSPDDRRRVVDHVIYELGLTSRRTIQIGNLSQEDRKRASIAAELISGPSLLLLDEPTAGLTQESERQVIAMLRRLADTGLIIVVATTSPAYRDMSDQVLLLTAAGTVAFAGAPAQIEAALGTTDLSDIFTRLIADPDGAHAEFVAREGLSPPAAHVSAAPVESSGAATRIGLGRQIAVAARRQIWVIVGDQRYFIFLTILPILFGALSLLVPGHTGLSRADPYGAHPDEALGILFVLNMGAVVMGTALTVRDVVGERFTFRREQALGLSASAYLIAKVLVYSAIAMIQAGILTTAAVVGKRATTSRGVLLADSAAELYVSVAATAVVSAIVALALSSLTKYREQLTPIAVLLILLSLVFCGATFPLAARYGFNVASWLVPARWGFAASASSVDLNGIDELATHDTLWTHSTGRWLFDMAVLGVFAVLGIALLRWRLRRPARD